MNRPTIHDLPGVQWIDDYRDGRAWFRIYTTMHGNLYGFIDRRQRVVIQPVFKRLAAYNEGMAAFHDGRRWGFIDRRGKVVIGAQFYDITDGFRHGLCAVRKTGDSRYGYIDKKGRFVIKPEFTLAFPFSEGRAKVAHDGQFYFIDKRGRIKTQPLCSYRGI